MMQIMMIGCDNFNTWEVSNQSYIEYYHIYFPVSSIKVLEFDKVRDFLRSWPPQVGVQAGAERGVEQVAGAPGDPEPGAVPGPVTRHQAALHVRRVWGKLF